RVATGVRLPVRSGHLHAAVLDGHVGANKADRDELGLHPIPFEVSQGLFEEGLDGRLALVGLAGVVHVVGIRGPVRHDAVQLPLAEGRGDRLRRFADRLFIAPRRGPRGLRRRERISKAAQGRHGSQNDAVVHGVFLSCVDTWSHYMPPSFVRRGTGYLQKTLTFPHFSFDNPLATRKTRSRTKW